MRLNIVPIVYEVKIWYIKDKHKIQKNTNSQDSVNYIKFIYSVVQNLSVSQLRILYYIINKGINSLIRARIFKSNYLSV